MDWLDLLAHQGTVKSFLQHRSSKALILCCSAFFIVQLSHPYINNGKTIALARPTFVSKVMSLLFNTLSSLVMAFLPGSSCLLMSWLQSTLASLRPWFPALHLDHSASSYALPSVCFFWHRYQVQLLSLSAPPQPAPLHIPLRFCCLFHHFIHPALG